MTEIVDPMDLGRFGRVPAAPPGTLYVRDPDAVRSVSIKAQVALYGELGEPVPQHLADLAAALPAVDDPDIVQIETGAGSPVSEVTLSGQVPVAFDPLTGNVLAVDSPNPLAAPVVTPPF